MQVLIDGISFVPFHSPRRAESSQPADAISEWASFATCGPDRLGPACYIVSPRGLIMTEAGKVPERPATAIEAGIGRRLLRRAAQQRGWVVAAAVMGFAIGLAYRGVIERFDDRSLGMFLRSGLHGVGIGLTVWTVQSVFALAAQSRFGTALRRLPVAAEVVLRALAMTAALLLVIISLQALLYADPYRLHWLTRGWLTGTLPNVVAVGFGLSLVVGVLAEIQRLIGGPLLTSVLLGTYHRPARRRLIVMFLDIAHSTRLAEAMGELSVHDLITRFFFDIDAPIADLGGAVHAYVGDEVIVSWPVSDDEARNTRSIACFFAIDSRIRELAPEYERRFGVVPAFRAGIHAGPVVVSECGDMKRQLAYFGDTMNVAARLCEYCKTIDRRLVVSGELMRLFAVPDGLDFGVGERIAVRGREAPVEAYAVDDRGGGTLQ
jgi:class 3 adenylate cyclase